MNKTPRRRRSSTPYHSFVPSVAKAADEAKMAGMTPAAAAIKPFFASTGVEAMERADLTPKAGNNNDKEEGREKTVREVHLMVDVSTDTHDSHVYATPTDTDLNAPPSADKIEPQDF
jgi:hypothetical protein